MCLAFIMQEFPNLRYSRKVQLYQRTAELKQEHLNSKSSADNQHASFRLTRMLPKITTQQRRGKPLSVEFETFEQKQKENGNSFCKKQSKTVMNLTKLSFRQTRRQRESNDNRYEVVTKQGKRPYNEDRYICQTRLVSPYPQFSNSRSTQYSLYAVFDGHGGKFCAEFLKQNFSLILSRSKQLEVNPEQALRETFAVVQQKFLALSESRTPLETSGSCAVACLVDKQKVYVANLGDSRALLLSQEGYLPLTHDHKPHEQGEKLRILKHGGKIYRDQHQNQNNVKIFKQMRVFPGNLNVSRTIGDAEVKLKKYGGLPGMISSTPDVLTCQIGSYQTLLLATDGLFQAFSNEEIADRFAASQKRSEGRRFIEELCEQAQMRSSDNITVVLVHFS